MHTSSFLGRAALVLAAMAGSSLHAEQGLLTFVFGPSSPEAARQSARAAAAEARHWAQTDNGAVELRRSGGPDVQTLDPATGPKEVDQMFADAVQATREADPPSFLAALDAAAQAATVRPGARIVVAVLNSPSFSSDGERTLENLGEICRDHGVRIVVFDVEDDSRHKPNAALQTLVSKTGGAWVRQAKDLAPQVATVTPLAAESIPAASVAPAETAPKTSESAPKGVGEMPPFVIPVWGRFMRTSGTGSTSNSITDHEADFGQTFTLTSTPAYGGGGTSIAGGGGSMEVSYWPNDPHAPLQGLVTVEAPLTAIRFDIDDTAGVYIGHARITAVVKDAKGVAIWTQRKEVNLRGPISKLPVRRTGSMFFMRGVSLIGQGPFTLESKVEDLVGKTSGTSETQLRVGRNAPSLTATDAIVVRPFKSSGDMFESDQVLAYEGEALVPVLDPVFRSDQPINLQIYLRIYPDLQGAPLDLSMEILNEGKVVGKMSLPFKGALSNSGLEGPSSGASGTSNIVGGKAHEFPYLVDMKGAKFPPGDYEGIISIRQGKSVVRRLIAFKVTGNASAKAPANPATGPQTSTEDTETASIVLPEIEPATVDSTGLRMRQEDQKKLWDEAAKNAMGYLAQLPNFRCVQETHRFTAPAKTPASLREADSYQDELVFEDSRERYQRLETNGLKVDNAPVDDTGVHSRNEFGTLLRSVFAPETAAAYRWAGRSMTLGVLCQVFEFEVSRTKSNFILHAGSSVAAVAYTGRVFIDEQSGMVRRLTIEGTGLAKEFQLQSPSLSLDYGMVKIGEKDYLLPLRSTLQLRQSKVFVRNESVFREYRKFQADSKVQFGK